MTLAYAGFPAVLQVDNSGYTSIAGIRDIAGPALALNPIDVSTRDATPKGFVAGMLDPGEVTFDIVYDPDDSTHRAGAAPGLPYLLETKTLAAFKLLFPDRPAPDVWVDITVQGSASADEIQTLTLTGTPTGGTFTLTFGGYTTSSLLYSASAATVQTALRALTSINGANVTVTGNNGGPYTVTFVGSLAKTNVGAITATSSMTDAAQPSVAFDAYVTKVAPKAPLDGAQTADVTLRISGDLTWT
jgi:hypothetical protein